MTDEGIDVCNIDHKSVNDFVESKYVELSNISVDSEVDYHVVNSLILKLNKGASAGSDGITAEHLCHGLSTVLCQTLSDIYSAILSFSVIPNVLAIYIGEPCSLKHAATSFTIEVTKAIISAILP